MNEASNSSKRVLLHVGSNACGYCKMWLYMTQNDTEVRDLLRENFVHLGVSSDDDNRNEWVVERYLPDTPGPYRLSLVVLESDGTPLRAADAGFLLRAGGGYNTDYDRGRVLAFLKRWAPPHESQRGE